MDIIEILSELSGTQMDEDFIVLVARNFGWTAQVASKNEDDTPILDEGGNPVMIDNPETADNCVGRNIAMYIKQCGINQKKIDNEEAIEEAIEEMRNQQDNEMGNLLA